MQDVIVEESTLEKWAQLASDLKVLKEKEVELRREICQEILKGTSGEARVGFDTENFEVTAEGKVNRTIDKTVLLQMWDELSTEEQNCIRYDPKLNLARYRKLPEDSILHEAITEKQSPTPVLKVEVRMGV